MSSSDDFPIFIRRKPSRGASLLNQTFISRPVNFFPFTLAVIVPAIQLASYSLPATLIFSVPSPVFLKVPPALKKRRVGYSYGSVRSIVFSLSLPVRG